MQMHEYSPSLETSLKNKIDIKQSKYNLVI
jgi:hypothetical protein